MCIAFDNLAKIIFSEIIPKLERSYGLAIFAKERAKFEGWLKVELCDSLSKYFQEIIPEKDRIGITFNNWAIELKTINTSYRYNNVKNKTRPITKNVQEVISDIKKLKSSNFPNKAVLFVVFPVEHNHTYWQKHLSKINKHVKKLEHREFKFKNGVPAVIYFGIIK